MLKIWGRSDSANVQKVLWACDEMGVPFDREDVGGKFGRTKEPFYLAMNPNARVPTIDEDGFVLWESNACVRYLAAKHDRGGLCPADPQAYADADRWMDWQQTTVVPFMTPIFWNLVRVPEPERDHAAVDRAVKQGLAVWPILEARLEDRDFILGDRVTMADVPLAIQAYRWVKLVEDRPSMPRLEAWLENCRARPGFKQWIDQPLT
ncbi:MAG TPA: glutathione S-transferase family protein [Gammaproteobacteria bacterium]|nr:glutathione S-transferase family protein [Gammaproteobacteria bacterium]